MPEAMREGQQQAVVRHMRVFERTPHLEVQAVADEHERNIVQRVRIALAQFVCPDEQRVVQQAAGSARFRRFGQPFGQIRQLARNTTG